jgi:hypothetical protein
MAKVSACRPQNRSNRKNQKKLWAGVLPKAEMYPHIKFHSIIEIAPAVTKRALLTNDDGRHVIAIG